MALTRRDLEQVQHQLDGQYRLELVEGEIRIMSPSSYESDEIASEFSARLWNWVKPRQLGRITGAGAGFTLPNGDTRAPDVSFVEAHRLRRSPRSFADLAPDLMVEVKSPTDSVKGLRAKIDGFLEQGTQVGILIDPELRQLEIHRLGQQPISLRDGDILTLPDLLPGWELAVADLWPPVFDEP